MVRAETVKGLLLAITPVLGEYKIHPCNRLGA